MKDYFAEYVHLKLVIQNVWLASQQLLNDILDLAILKDVYYLTEVIHNIDPQKYVFYHLIIWDL